MRRFFLLDTSLGTKPGSSSQVVQWAAELSLQVAIRADQRNAIYPPVLKVRCAAARQAAATPCIARLALHPIEAYPAGAQERPS